MLDKNNKSKRIVMFGGTFDPIHNGHMMIARTFLELLKPKRFYIVPTRIPPHKSCATCCERDRLNMCKIAAAELGYPCFASPIELKREGPSWSFYTVTALKKRFTGFEVYLIIGADMFISLESWHRFDELKELVTFCTVARDDIGIEQLREYGDKLSKQGVKCLIAPCVPLDVSSTEIRELIAAGTVPEELLPKGVRKYIVDHNLYIDK